ncbi:MAG: hypothetical protein R6U89_08465 [Dehalococcoidia bacterium]
MGRSRYRILYGDTVPCFLTCTTTNWIAMFGNPEVAGIVLDSLKYLADNGRMAIRSAIKATSDINSGRREVTRR